MPRAKRTAIFITHILIFTILIDPLQVFATPADFAGGVNNEYMYEEMVFITGKPLKFQGTVSITQSERNDTKTVSYRFDLKAPDEPVKTQLKRTVTYVTTYDRNNDKGQAIAQTSVTRYSETVQIDKDQYTLDNYQFSKSDIIDERPASDFYSGNFKGRKHYVINRTEGEVVVDISGGDVGYENFWGSTETQLIDYNISSKRYLIDPQDKTKKELVTWEGSVRAQVSDSLTKSLKYSDNEADLSSFNGGYIRTTDQEQVSKYDYDLPKMDGTNPNGTKRNKDEISLSAKMVPKVERLIVPKFRDIEGHWAQDYIGKLYSLDVFEGGSAFFVPEAPMTRAEFTRAVIRACNIRTTTGTQKSPISWRKQPPEVSPFKDVPTTDPDYQYIKEGLAKGIISGESKDLFKPKNPLTRAQAITILIRALGFINKAPSPGYQTSFSDDDKIPSWAKDGIYVGREIGIIQGDEYNKVNPDKVMTRAEASAMLVRFLEFLQKDLQKDYRENIMMY